jgi:hypothetical protein
MPRFGVTVTNDKKYEQIYTAYMATYEDTKDPIFLIQAYKLWKDGKIIIKDIDHQYEKPAFYEKNKYGKTCCRCNCALITDQPVWKIKDRALNKNKYWCLNCATPEEKQNDSFFQNWNRHQSAKAPKPIKEVEVMYMPNHPDADAQGNLWPVRTTAG